MAGIHRTHPPRVRLAVAAVVVSLSALGVGAVLASAEPEAQVSDSATASASATSSTPRTVQVVLREKNNSGVSGTATVTGSKVVATADGLDPNRVYYSYVYGAGSSASGNNPCVLSGARAAGPVDTVGRWRVGSDGHGTLTGSITLPQLDPGTLSIRRNDTGTRGLAGPTPLDPLQACGAVGPRRATVLGTVQDQLPPVKVSTPAVIPTP